LFLIATAGLLGACAGGGHPRSGRAPPPVLTPAEQVRITELSFAQAMAHQDFAAFMGHVSNNAIFFGGRSIERGPAEVAAAWKPLFDATEPPFEWAPDVVEVLKSGDLALSSGDVTIHGKVVGRYNSIWRLEAPNTWRIVFDKGEMICAPGKP
jgi:ketosteroid isomerase-like protein